MELIKYLELFAVLLAADFVFIAIVVLVGTFSERRRQLALEQKRWTLRNNVQLVLWSICCWLLLAMLIYPFRRHLPLHRQAAVVSPWRRVMPIEGHFTVEMPGRPNVSTIRQQTAYGYAIQHSVTFDQNVGPSFSAYSTDFPPKAKVGGDSLVLLNRVRENILQDGHMKLMHSMVVTQAGLTGIEFACDKPEDGRMLFRCFIANNRLYTLWVGPVTEDDENDAKVQHFFDSFKIE